MREIKFDKPKTLTCSLSEQLRDNYLYSDVVSSGEYVSIRYIPYVEEVFCLCKSTQDEIVMGLLNSQEKVDTFMEYIEEETHPIVLHRKDEDYEDFILFSNGHSDVQVYSLPDCRTNYIALLVELFSKNRDKGSFTIIANKDGEEVAINHYAFTEKESITRYDLGDGNFIISKGDDVSEMLCVLANKFK